MNSLPAIYIYIYIYTECDEEQSRTTTTPLCAVAMHTCNVIIAMATKCPQPINDIYIHFPSAASREFVQYEGLSYISSILTETSCIHSYTCTLVHVGVLTHTDMHGSCTNQMRMYMHVPLDQ